MDETEGQRVKKIKDYLYAFGSYFNIYLLKGEDPAIVEGGISALYQPLKKALQEVGVGIHDVKKAFVLHAHVDHLMAFSPLKRETPSLSILGSEPAQKALFQDKVWKRMRSVDDHIGERLRSKLRLPYKKGEGRRVLIDRVLKDGDCLELGGKRIDVVYTPGHSPCSLSLVINEEALLVSDSLGGWLHRSRSGLHPNYFWNLRQYIESIKRLASIPCHVVCLGHNGYLMGEKRIKRFFAYLWESLYSFIEEVDRKVKTPEDFEKASHNYAESWYTSFLQLFPFDVHLGATTLMIRRTLEYLDRCELIKGDE